MRTLSAKHAKYGIGRLIDLARASSVMVAKHGCASVAVLSVEGCKLLKVLNTDETLQETDERE